MKFTITCSVTEDDIRLGKQCHSERCAIARAIKRSLKGNKDIKQVDRVDVTNDMIVIITKSNAYYGSPTKKAANFIDRFDMNKDLCKPNQFTLTFESSR